MDNDQVAKSIAKAKQVAGSKPAAAVAEQADDLATELREIRRRLGTPEGAQQALDAYGTREKVLGRDEIDPKLLRAITGRSAPVPVPIPRRVLPGGARIATEPLKIDTEGLVRRAKEIFQEGDEEKRERDRQMLATMEKMHAALVEANQRELEALDSARIAEERDTFMLRVAVASTAFGGLSFAAAVVAIIVALNAH